ncbi:MAG TPA: terminase, partial [Clostridiaceae bacterium]|nr:terminase [Clostridiaceae bacterium]
GWRFKDNKNKFRYNDNTLFIARKNSKTATIALVFILLMLTEQNYSEFYSICLTKELASEIKKIMAQIINASPLIKKYFTISLPKT